MIIDNDNHFYIVRDRSFTRKYKSQSSNLIFRFLRRAWRLSNKLSLAVPISYEYHMFPMLSNMSISTYIYFKHLHEQNEKKFYI